MTEIEEIMRRVRKLEIKARRLVNESFSGDYHSSFKGQGLDFEEHREYQHGDEIRFIDWNVTARMGSPFIRTFKENREVSAIIAVDVSASGVFGSVHLSKRELAAETAAVLGFSALQSGDKVGLLLFAEEAFFYLPPAKGTRHILRMVREILTADPVKKGTSIKNACDFLMSTAKRKSLVFLISDFFDHDYEKKLTVVSRKHELIALRIGDPIERELPNVGRINLIDPETGHQSVVNTSNSNVRMGYAKLMRRQREGTREIFKKNNIDYAELSTAKDSLPTLHKLFQRRARRRTV